MKAMALDTAPLKIVVTGAMGHIGSHLIRRLPAQFPGADIVMVDNLLTQRYASLFGLPSTGHYRFVEADVTTCDLAPLLQDAHAVVHLAAITDAAGSFAHPDEVEAHNYAATSRVADACAAAGARFVGVFSTSIYSGHNRMVSEHCPAEELEPQSPYARSKLREETLIQRLCAARGLRAVLFRFGTVFGVSPGMRFHTAVNKFCWQAAMGRPLTVWSTAYDQQRPYLDLDDAARAIAFAIQRDLFAGRIYNVLTLNATVRQIVDVIRSLMPDAQVEFVDSPIMSRSSYEVSRQRLMDEGFTFTGHLQRAIGETMALLGHANGRRLAAVP